MSIPVQSMKQGSAREIRLTVVGCFFDAASYPFMNQLDQILRPTIWLVNIALGKERLVLRYIPRLCS